MHFSQKKRKRKRPWLETIPILTSKNLAGESRDGYWSKTITIKGQTNNIGYTIFYISSTMGELPWNKEGKQTWSSLSTFFLFLLLLLLLLLFYSFDR